MSTSKAETLEELQRAQDLNHALQKRIQARLERLRDSYGRHKELALNSRVALHMHVENSASSSKSSSEDKKKQQQQQKEQQQVLTPEYSLVPVGKEDSVYGKLFQGPLRSWRTSVLLTDSPNQVLAEGMQEADPFTVRTDPSKRVSEAVDFGTSAGSLARLKKSKRPAAATSFASLDSEDVEEVRQLLTNRAMAKEFLRHTDPVGTQEKNRSSTSVTPEPSQVNEEEEEREEDDDCSFSSAPPRRLGPFEDTSEASLSLRFSKKLLFCPPLDDDSDGLASIMLRFPPPGHAPTWSKEAVDYLESLVSEKLKNLLTVEEIPDSEDDEEQDQGDAKASGKDKKQQLQGEGEEEDQASNVTFEDEATWTEIARLMNKRFLNFGNMPCALPSSCPDVENEQNLENEGGNVPADTGTPVRSLYWGEVEFSTNEERIHTQQLFRQPHSMTTNAQYSPINCAQQWHNVIRPMRDGRTTTSISGAAGTSDAVKSEDGGPMGVGAHGAVVTKQRSRVNYAQRLAPLRLNSSGKKRSSTVSAEFDQWLKSEVQSELLRRLDENPESETIPNLDIRYWRSLAARAPSETPLSLCSRYMSTNLIYLCKQKLAGYRERSGKRGESQPRLLPFDILEPSQPRPSVTAISGSTVVAPAGEKEPMPSSIRVKSTSTRTQRQKRKRKTDSDDEEEEGEEDDLNSKVSGGEASASTAAGATEKSIATPSLEPQDISSQSLTTTRQRQPSSAASPPLIWQDPDKSFLLDTLSEMHSHHETTTCIMFSLLCGEATITSGIAPTWYPLDIVFDRLHSLRLQAGKAALDADFPLFVGQDPSDAEAEEEKAPKEGDHCPASSSSSRSIISASAKLIGLERALLTSQVMILRHQLGPNWRSIANICFGGVDMIEAETYVPCDPDNVLGKLIKSAPADVARAFTPMKGGAPGTTNTVSGQDNNNSRSKSRKGVTLQVPDVTTNTITTAEGTGADLVDGTKEDSTNGKTGGAPISSSTAASWPVEDLAKLADLLSKHVAWAAIPPQLAGGKKYTLAECKAQWVGLPYQRRQEAFNKARSLFDGDGNTASGPVVGDGGLRGARQKFPQGAITVTSGLGVSTMVDGNGSTAAGGTEGAFDDDDDDGAQSLVSTAASSSATFGGAAHRGSGSGSCSGHRGENNNSNATNQGGANVFACASNDNASSSQGDDGLPFEGFDEAEDDMILY